MDELIARLQAALEREPDNETVKKRLELLQSRTECQSCHGTGIVKRSEEYEEYGDMFCACPYGSKASKDSEIKFMNLMKTFQRRVDK